MAKAKKQVLTQEELLQQALVPEYGQPYKVPENWVWTRLEEVSTLYTGNRINEKIKENKYIGKTDGLNYIGTRDIGFDNIINYENGVCITDYYNFKIAPTNTALLCIEGGSAGRMFHDKGRLFWK